MTAGLLAAHLGFVPDEILLASIVSRNCEYMMTVDLADPVDGQGEIAPVSSTLIRLQQHTIMVPKSTAAPYSVAWKATMSYKIVSIIYLSR